MRYFFIFIYVLFSFSKCFSSSFITTEEDTLKSNFYTLCCSRDMPPILHGALEGPDAIVGGLGAVLKDLSIEMGRVSPRIFTTIPYYLFLKQTLPIKYKIHSLGFMKHLIFGRTTTTEVLWCHENRQLLLNPDYDIRSLCEVVTGRDKIYESTQSYLRLVFFNSALARFADIVDAEILHLHAWQTSLVAPLIKRIYNHKRLQNGLKEIKVVATIHMFSEEQGKDSDSIYVDVNLPKSLDGTVNLAATGILESDILTTVSEGIKTYFYNKGTSYGLDEILSKKVNFTHGITNGIHYPSFNPFLNQNLGGLLKKPLTEESLFSSKRNAKELLFINKLIPYPDRPLMLYIGRFSDEKGVEYLENIAEEWISLGGQMVVMGVLTQDKRSSDIIERLVTFQETIPPFQGNLKIYTDLRKDQLENVSKEISIPKGKLFRFATDFLCIPSKAEACGLVAMESLCFGTPVFTSWVQGLKDMCFPYGIYHPISKKISDENDFNSVSFQYNPSSREDTIEDIKKNLVLAYRIAVGEEIDLEKKLSAQVRMIEEAESFDWHAPGGAIEKYMTLYKDLMGEFTHVPSLYEYPSQLDEDHLTQYLIEKLGCYPSQKLTFSYRKTHPFILCTLVQGIREKESIFNTPTLKENTRVIINNGVIYRNDGITLFDTHQMKKEPNFYVTWALNKNGELFCGAFCHAFFLKSKPGSPNYGYGKPIACSGDLIVSNGKIYYIDNRSGHYYPNLDQFLIALHYFYSLGLLAEGCEIREEATGRKILFEEFIDLDIENLLKKYSPLNQLIGSIEED